MASRGLVVMLVGLTATVADAASNDWAKGSPSQDTMMAGKINVAGTFTPDAGWNIQNFGLITYYPTGGA